jgi:hypothetical protein
MTTELTQPQSELGPVQANGQEQSQGHRRRRRRRKNKSSQASAVPAQQASVQAQSQPPIQAPATQRRSTPTHQGGRQGGHPSQGRKKKFFQKGSAMEAQPGNSISGSSQNRRKGRQKVAREFVGPMDHSYRIVNGNIADGPRSTVQITTNGGPNSDYYEEACEPTAPVAIREDTPTRIFCFIEDMFFLAKIHETARKLGVKVEFVKGDKETVAKLTGLPEDERPKLVVFDLNNLNAKPLTLIPKLKAKFKKATSIVGFVNRLQGDLKAKAVEVGCDTVMPRAAFSQSLPGMLRRYGMEEEEDYSQQPAEYATQLV